MDQRKLRNNLVRAFAAVALGAGLAVGGVVLNSPHADEVVWMQPGAHRIQVKSDTSAQPTAPAPTFTTFEVVWM